MISPTLGNVSLREAAAVIAKRTGTAEPGQYDMVIGTDSQNFDKTKVVLVVALHHVGHGGFFFYEAGTYDYTRHLNLSIHVDAGLNGPSRQVIPEIVGWITACGFAAVIKPDSYAACSIANKYSK